LRIAVAPDGNGRLEARVERREASAGAFMSLSGIKAPRATVSLGSLPLAGGLGGHKWVDRSLLDEAQSRLPAETLPLVVDRDGAVLEASRANVFAVRDGALLTPPTDGRILPGVTRARVLEVGAAIGLEAREAELSDEDLLGADEVFLTGSVRGVERVAALDGTALATAGEIASHLGAELRRAWAGAAQVG
jgi:para-aminobenzoate synthetase/4-amino-4-deoxychorismate lyase